MWLFLLILIILCLLMSTIKNFLMCWKLIKDICNIDYKECKDKNKLAE